MLSARFLAVRHYKRVQPAFRVPPLGLVGGATHTAHGTCTCAHVQLYLLMLSIGLHGGPIFSNTLVVKS